MGRPPGRPGGPWTVGPEETAATLLNGLHVQAARSRAIISAHALDEVGELGERWDGADPATLERVLFHLLQEYARHVGHLDVIVELAAGRSGELKPAQPALSATHWFRHSPRPSIQVLSTLPGRR